MYTFGITKEGDPYLEDDGIAAIIEFNVLDSAELKYVVLTYDRGTPYRHLRGDARIEKVCSDLCIKKPERAAITKAINKLESLQDEEVFKLDDIYSEKLDQVNKLIRDTKPTLDNAKELKDLMSMQVEITKNVVELRRQVNDLLANRKKEGSLRAGRQKSILANTIQDIHKKIRNG